MTSPISFNARAARSGIGSHASIEPRHVRFQHRSEIPGILEPTPVRQTWARIVTEALLALGTAIIVVGALWRLS